MRSVSASPDWPLRRALLLLVGLILASLSVAIRYQALQQSVFANGWDGYFYLVQLRSLVETGEMHSKDWSLIYPLLLAVHSICGDYVLAYKITAALLAGGVTLGFYGVAYRWSGSLTIALLLGSLSLFSPHLTYFTAQYPKNLLGLLLLLAFLYTLASQRRVLTLGLLLLNYFGHRLTFGLSALFLVFWIGLKKIPLAWLAWSLVALAGIVVLSLGFKSLPGWVDLGRFAGSFSTEPQLATYSFLTTFEGPISLFWRGELIWTTALYVLSIPFLIKIPHSKQALALFGICTILLFPFFEWSYTSMAYRFFLVFVLLTPLFLALLLPARVHRIKLLVLALLLMGGSIFSYKSYQPTQHDANYKLYARLTENAQAALQEKPVELVIAHNALAEYFTFTTGIDAMPWLPEYAIAPEKAWRIAAGVRLSELEYYLLPEEIRQVVRIGVRYYLLPEHLWQKALEKAAAEGEEVLLKKWKTWRNPYRLRPDFLLKKKDSSF